jgi:beta-1,4-N-acetylglucosaminyltransferase
MFPKSAAKTLVVLGSGGHTAEILQLMQSIKMNVKYAHKYHPLSYIAASSDTTSIARLDMFDLVPQSHVYKIPRSREVGQSYTSSIFTTMYAICYALLIVLYERPDLVLMNGPGTCLPIAISTFLSRVLGLSLGRIVFVESFCRVKSLSLTGKILETLGIVDLFLVHWPELLTETHDRVLMDSFMKHET